MLQGRLPDYNDPVVLPANRNTVGGSCSDDVSIVKYCIVQFALHTGNGMFIAVSLWPPVQVEGFCNRIHKGIIKQFKYALVWGTSVKHRPQKVGKEHVLQDEDIVQIVKKI